MAFDDRFRRELRSIEYDGWKLIEDNGGDVELYNLRRDPGEMTDLSMEEPERVVLMRTSLGPPVAYRRGDLSPGEPLSKEALERLRSLGYVR